MLRRSMVFSAITFLLSGNAPADVTVRQSNSMKLPSFIPPEIANQWQPQSPSGADGAVLRIKGNKAYASYGALETLTDYSRNEVTLLDSKTKRYATVPLSEFSGRLGAALKGGGPDLAAGVQSKRTGQTAIIRGVRAEETLTVITMQMPFMATSSGGSDDPSLMRLEVRSWIAQPAEIRRVPALGELADYVARGKRVLDTADFAEEALSAVPMLGEQLGAALRELSKDASGLTMKTSISVYLPAITQLVQLAPKETPPGFDPNGPIAESTLELTDISTASLPDSDFQVPADFDSAPFEELVRAASAATGTLPAIR